MTGQKGDNKMNLCDHCIRHYDLDCDYRHLPPGLTESCKGFLLDFNGMPAAQKNMIQSILSDLQESEAQNDAAM